MKKNLLLGAIAIILSMFISSCKPTPEVIFPQDLIGFWQCQTNNDNIWYGLEVVSSQSATLYTYEYEEEVDAVAMSLTYDPTTGKGQLTGEGIFLQITASSQTVIYIKMVEGDIAFTKGKKPAKVYSITGLWKSTAIDDMRVDLLIFPKKENQINIAYMEVDEFFGDVQAMIGSILSLDEKTGKGEITASYHSGELFVDTTTNPLTITYTEDGVVRSFTKQPKKEVIIKSLQGKWNMSVPGTATATINVDENNFCTINYTLTTINKTKTGTTEGILYYCPQAGMAAIAPAHEVKNEDFIELFGEEACGILYVKSSTEMLINTLGIEILFKKQ